MPTLTTWITWLGWIPLGVSTAWIVAGFLAVWAATRRRREADVELARPAQPVSVLKPLCGRDADLEENLDSFFRQDHRALELVFGAVDERDPALDVVRSLMARYPDVPARIVVHGGAGALNPKVDNLLGMLPAARHDLLLVSDSNVRAPSHYVRELVTLHERERAGVVTNLFAGTGEDTLGAALENVQLSGFVAAGIALPTALGDPILVGKSALFSRRTLDRLGGMKRLADVLAEDFVMGKTFAHAGEKVVVAPTVLSNVTRVMSVRQTLSRQLRWMMFRFRLRPVVAALEPLVSPLAQLPLAWFLFGPAALVWACGLLLLRDTGGWLALRGARRLYVPFLLSPVRELLVLLLWLVAPFKTHVSWRGKRFRLGAGTLLYLDRQRISQA
jgi:ceramide glucosyltransferase